MTPQLADCFDEALDTIRGAVTGGRGKAAFLHGSFSSGKSRFMAVLHLLLRRETAARAQPGLEQVVRAYDA